MTDPFNQDMGELFKTVRVSCSVCKKMVTFCNMKRHMKTVHDGAGKKWACNVCGKISQTEVRLTRHQRVHRAENHETNDRDENVYNCPDCRYTTLNKNYLVDHRRLMHTIKSHGQFICVTGKCFQKPQTFPNQTKLEKHKTCHENPKCGQCGKVFGARRNLRRHENNVHANDHANLSTNSNT